ncbi:MAG TPA: long-chain fatty acid--CoA ligase [Spirochaetota bacterium]|nr:long-chain fatty acid--CoA ligase [Spirochaetota bacterium]HQO01512.1 long-chain fatty acid--CoA ligase [Spirochaetota bacterium]HQP50145.1 long-chain fatty acid--CoA ligase [Spirochaetota bacterium]
MAGEIRYQDKPWLKHYDPGVPSTINYKEICLHDMLANSVKEYPGNTALIFEGYKITYRQLQEMVDRFATCLHALGVKKGDAVAVLLPNMIPTIAAYYAILKIGAVVVMNNPLYTDHELEHQFNDSGSVVLITIDLLANRMIDLRPKTKIKHIIYTSIGDYLPFPKSILFPLVGKKKGMAADVKAAPEVYKWKDCIRNNEPNPPKTTVTFDDVAVYQYTGGTTGVSKGAMLTHRNLGSMVQMYEAWFSGERGKEIAMASPPVFHVLGMSAAMNLPVYMGWTTVLIPKPQAPQLLAAIRKYRPTMSPLVPTMYIGMLEDPDIRKTDLTCFKLITSGGASLPVEILNKFKELTGVEINEGFGMTETSPQTHLNPFNGRKKPGSIGLPYPDTEVRVVDLETGTKDVPVGEPGEMLFRGPQITKGYLNRPEETEKSIKDGWLSSGDIAYMDEEGYFFVVDRKKDLIISSGYNVYPRDVEEVFYEHPKVNKVAVIGIPDQKRGENIKAFITLKEGQNVTTDELMEYCRTKLAKYKWPADIEIRDALPESNVGKILKKELRAEVLKK